MLCAEEACTLRTDGVHCRESAGTVPVVLKVVPVTSAAIFAGHHGPINVRRSFPTPTNGMKWAWDNAVRGGSLHSFVITAGDR